MTSPDDLVRLADRLETDGADGERAAAHAAALPRSLPADAPPEAALALARLHLLLRRHLRDRPWPRWREADPPVPVRIAWLRAEIAAEPGTAAREPGGEPLYQAVHGLRATDVDEPEHLVRVLLERDDAALRAEALRITREAVRAALLAPSKARALLLEIAVHGGAGRAAEAALRELAEPWAALDPIPHGPLRRLLDSPSFASDAEASGAAVEAAARHGHLDLLRDVAAGADRPPALRRRALELAGGLARREDVPGLAGIAAEDPLLLAGAGIGCLLGMHRRGHFPSGEHVPAIVGLALADHSVPAGEVATLLFTCREEMLRELTCAAPGGPGPDGPELDDWPRRLELLVALAAQGTGDLPVGETITRLLPAAADPVPFLRAIRALRYIPAERAVLALLPRVPAAALDALEAVGAEATAAALREGLGLGLEPDGTGIAPHLRAVRHRALELLWHLTDGAEERRALLARLDPRDLPRRILSDLGGPDPRELELLRAGLDPGEPAAALCVLARNGDAGTVPAVTDLLLRVVSDLAASWAPDAAEPEAAEPRVPDEVLAAIRDLGGRLHERGRIRPRCLLDAAGPREAGDALAATMALGLLDDGGLEPSERAILLELLRRTPSYGGVRAGVHPLLRDRDRHVRKQAIALLARDADGTDARALSAGLIALTSAGDAQTVRQAVVALGRARARGAAPALAACLDHPVMNVKKAAAEALARAGTPEAVPALLSWLGRHDNPGLREALVEALRAVLGDGFAAALVAAADRAGDERTRDLLLRGLDRALSARAVAALAGQGSPSGRTLLSLVADGRVVLASGTAADLAEPMAEHGIRPPRDTPPPGAAALADVKALEKSGWDAATARRLVRHEEDLPVWSLRRLRPLLDRWLELAGAERDCGPVLRLTLRLCPSPWDDRELEVFARSAAVLASGLARVEGADREALVAVLGEAVPRLAAAGSLAVAARLRALRPEVVGGRALLRLLRACGAVLTRSDLARALDAAGRAPDPRSAEEEVLREAFIPDLAEAPSQPAEREEHREWHGRLEEAARTPETLRRFRDAGPPLERPAGSRHRLAALAAVYPDAGAAVRDALLDWMLELQPLGAPAWTLAEDAGRTAEGGRAPRPGDLDQPRSAAQRERLLAMLDDPARERREAAARMLLGWPEPGVRRIVLRAYLDARIDLPDTAALAPALASLLSGIRPEDPVDGTVAERAARVAAHLEPGALAPLVPLLLGWWEHGAPAAREPAGRALRRAEPDLLAEALAGRLDAGAWGVLDLLAGRPLLRTPSLVRACERLRAEGREDLAERIELVDGPLRDPAAARRDGETLAALRARTPPPAAADGGRGPSREALLDLARTGTTEQARRALTVLAERHDERAGGHRDPELEELLAEAIGHREARIRLHAHRLSRRVLDAPDYLEQTCRLLDDPRPDIVRSAIRSVSYAAWRPAIPALVGLLDHPRPAVRRAAADGLVRYGTPAARALRHAAGRARPDRRVLYTAVLDRIAAEGPPE
ncbi:HEAT repeat domain-containing protein [Spirillospora sp. CA-255316]